MLADQDTRVSEPQGMQQEMQQIYAKFGARGVVHRARGAARSAAPTIEKFIARRAAAEDLRLLPARHRPPRAAHAERCGREDPRRRGAARRLRVEHLRHPGQRRLPVSDDHAERRPDREGRPGGLRRAAHLAEPRRSQAGDVGVLHGARRLQPHVRHDDELERAEGRCSTPRRGSTRRTSKPSLDGPNIPIVGLHAADRRREQEPADVPSLPAAAQADDGDHRRPALLRPLRAARRRRSICATRRRKRRSTCWRRWRRSARDYAGGRPARVQRALARLASDRGQAVGRLLERRRLRRASVHAAQLPRAVQRREHAGARARPHDAQLLLEQDAAVPDGRTTRRSSRKWRRRSTRRCSSITC